MFGFGVDTRSVNDDTGTYDVGFPSLKLHVLRDAFRSHPIGS